MVGSEGHGQKKEMCLIKVVTLPVSCCSASFGLSTSFCVRGTREGKEVLLLMTTTLAKLAFERVLHRSTPMLTT